MTDNQLDSEGKRLKYLRTFLGMTQADFAGKINFPRQNLSKAENDNEQQGLSKEAIRNIILQFGVNYDWLIEGNGEMFKVPKQNNVNEAQPDYRKKMSIEKENYNYILNKEKVNYNVKGYIPFYDRDVTAGNMILFEDKEIPPSQHYFLPNFSDCTAIFPVYGDSMYPRFRAGDRVVVKEYTHFQSYLQYGEVFLIFTENEERMIKVVRKSERSGFIKLVSINQEYDDFEIPINIITKMFIVKGKICIEND